MGFGPSAGWAQFLAEVACEKAALPPSRRFVDGAAPPTEPPIWGSIEDDVWAVEQLGDSPVAA
eukprot:7457296-Lingulodinium_polyedra.AAC.1